jgi:cell pole-organizing protein PopZ
MEEILASIRRIIESNEPVSESALSADMSPDYGHDVEDSEAVSFAPDMAANDPGIPLRNEPLRDTIGFAPASANHAPQAEPRTMSLADVAARVRAASSRQQETDSTRSFSTPLLPPVPATSTRQDGSLGLRPQMPHSPELREPPAVRSSGPATPAAVPSVAPLTVSQSGASQPAVSRINPPVFDPQPTAVPMSARAETATRQEPSSVFGASAESLPAKIEEAANLLSAEAGAQVAKSFSDLAAVFNGVERRTLEDMAGEILRPMLQEWLDDNLPTLVERLVREEIERVSRGPRR